MSEQRWQKFALLLVDVQQDFWTEELQSKYPRFRQNVERLLGLCRAAGIEVVHLREVFDPSKSDWLPRYRLKGRSPCVRGTAGVAVLDFAAELPEEKVIEKQTQDGFHNPELLSYLQSKNKRYVLVAGLVTSVCVVFTAASAAQLGFLAAIVEDCCADYPEAHAIALRRFRGFLLDVVSSEEILNQGQHWSEQLRHLADLQSEMQTRSEK
jgi:nicotinamidase-related amidase